MQAFGDLFVDSTSLTCDVGRSLLSIYSGSVLRETD